MSKLISECILKTNFNRFGHKILIRNETSHTLLTKSEVIYVRELKDDGLTLELPINVCQKGHNLTLFFLNPETIPQTKLPDLGHYKEAQFEAMVKVEKIEKNKDKESMVFIDVHFTQYDIDGWKKIINACVKNQDDINSMIMSQHLERDDE